MRKREETSAGISSSNASSLPGGKTAAAANAKGHRRVAVPWEPGTGTDWHLLGIMWLAGASLMAHLILATATLLDPQQLCLKPAASPNVIVAWPDGNATLPCLEGELENSTDVYWKFEGRNLSTNPAIQVVPGPNLFLPLVYFNNSGSYSCHIGDRLLCAWRLVVEEPPRTPDFYCHRKSLTKDILCEWRTPRPMSLRTKAKLWMQKGFSGGKHQEQQCRYYAKSQKFTCRILGLNNGEDIMLGVSMCVMNLAGNASSHKYFNSESLLKPDPPADVVVHAVENATRQLQVTWRYPYSWGSTFYRLQFQLRYRVETSQTYTKVHLREGTSYTISDALQNLAHTVQVRGREEFDHGTWSEWSRESIGMPWTEPKDPESESTSSVSKTPRDDHSLSTPKPRTPGFPREIEKPTESDTTVPLHVFLIMAVSLMLVLALTVVFVARYRKRCGQSGEGKPSTVPSYSLAAFPSELPLSASPLLSPPASPFSESSVDSPRILEQGPYDISNADYFLLPK
ncbi:interleukin-6 receptor subunit alpha [Sceloporus undulatus]|uniref:interleukin-6 receptor subunit alpha n=1 Tax=Sceloporus undulatus TaxID=8520 RepID=UPI001C4DB5FB|nr:interleukin-6 receptor subunit alpha [Sceloporus undulatus]